MEILENKELITIKGGSAHTALWFAVGTVITFLFGLFDGIVNPNKCNR